MLIKWHSDKGLTLGRQQELDKEQVLKDSANFPRVISKSNSGSWWGGRDSVKKEE